MLRHADGQAGVVDHGVLQPDHHLALGEAAGQPAAARAAAMNGDVQLTGPQTTAPARRAQPRGTRAIMSVIGFAEGNFHSAPKLRE
jgi:hypothetical protein